MEKLIKEEKICRNNDSYLELLYIKNESKSYLDVYNIVNNYAYYIVRIDLSSFVNRTAIVYNASYFLFYEYEPIIGTNKRYVTKIFKFYDLDDNISVVDTIKNLVLKFNDSTLLCNPLSFNENCYSHEFVNSNTKSKMLNKVPRQELDCYIENLKMNTYGVNNNCKQIKKIINFNTYLENKLLQTGEN